MQLRKHLGILSWTAGDKLLFLGYGLVTWLQIRALSPEEYGLAAQLLTLQAWIAIVAEGSLLQSIIQYGHTETSRAHANFWALVLHALFTLGVAGLIVVLRVPLAALFNEPRFTAVATILPFYCFLGIPRSYALKLLQRELRVRDVFLTNAVWLGTSAAMTLSMLVRGTLRTFDDIALIACSAMGAGSIAGIILARDQLVWSRIGNLRISSILRFSFPQALMMAMATSIRQLDIFLVQLFFSTRAAGVYNAAKMLYRVFETGADAAVWLMYPVAVRMLHDDDRRHLLRILIAKALVLQILIAAIALIVLYAGGTPLLVGFLGVQYGDTVMIFNVMAIGALFLPFTMLQSVLLALHRVDRLLAITTTGVVAALLAYFSVGALDVLWLIGCGVAVYAATVAILLWATLAHDGMIDRHDIIAAVHDIRRQFEAVLQRSVRFVTRSD